MSSQQIGAFGPAGGGPTDGISDGANAYFFSAGSVNYTWDIWKTDGTAGGTKKLGTVTDNGNKPRDFALAGGHVFFLAGESDSYALELYTVNDAAGTIVKLGNLSPSGSYQGAMNLVAFNNQAYVVGKTTTNGSELFKSDGTVAGTQLAVEMVPGSGDGVTGAWQANGKLFLSAQMAAGGYGIYRSDGTQGGTTLLKQINTTDPSSQYRFVSGFVAAGSNVVFDEYTGYGHVLWRTDGTPAGTQPITSHAGGASLISGGDFAVYANSTSYYVSDGTDIGTQAVSGLPVSDYASFFAATNGAVYVPTEAGLYRVTQAGATKLFSDSAYQAYAVGDRVYFSGTYRGPTFLQDAVAVTDGTLANTQLLEDREPAVGGPMPTGFRKVAGGVIFGLAGKLYFIADNAPHLPGVSGYVFRDGNQNGVRDAGEGGETIVSLSPTIATDPSTGYFEAKWLQPGTFTLTATPSAEYVVPTTVTSHTYNLAEGDSISEADFGFRRVNIIRGSVVIDQNSNDVGDSTEPVAAGQTVYIDLDRDGVVDPNEPATTSGADGKFEFYDVAAGNLRVRVAPSQGWYVSAPVAPGFDVAATIDGGVFNLGRFGVTQTPPRNYVSAIAFEELNSNGLRDANEKDLVVARIWVDLNDNAQWDSGEPTSTNRSNGTFLLPGPGTYHVCFQKPDGWIATTDPVVTLAPGERAYELPLGAAVPTASGNTLAGFAFLDSDSDGLFDPGESVRSGVRIYSDLDGDFAFDSNEASVITDSLGRFAFVNLAPGPYALRQEIPDVTLGQTAPAPGEALNITLADGEQRTDLLFGAMYPRTVGTVSGSIFVDDNVNGVRDTGEKLSTSDLMVYIDLNNNATRDLDEPAVPVFSGKYNIANLAAGRYRLRFLTSFEVFSASTYGADGAIFDIAGGQARTIDIGIYRPNGRITAAQFDRSKLPLVVRLNYDSLPSSTAVLNSLRVNDADGNTVTPSSKQFAQGATLNVSFTSKLADGSYRLTIPGTALHGSPGLPTPPDYTFDFFMLAGDGDGSGTVDIADFNLLAANFGKSAQTFNQGNYDYGTNGKVDIVDFNILAGNFGKHVTPLAPPVTATSIETAVRSIATSPATLAKAEKHPHAVDLIDLA